MKNHAARIGLTGSIGMGKSTVAQFFQEEGLAIWDADQSVHRLYQKGEPGFDAIADLCPTATNSDAVDRDVLAKSIADDPQLLQKIEAVIHPLVAQDRAAFHEAHKTQITLCDIPLLLENQSQSDFDFVVVVHADAQTQRSRVLARPEMTLEKFNTITGRQLPSEEKVKFADFVIRTDVPLEETRAQVKQIVSQIKSEAS